MALQKEPELDLMFDLRRDTSYYSSFVILPTFFFVAMGYGSFFINRAAGKYSSLFPKPPTNQYYGLLLIQ